MDIYLRVAARTDTGHVREKNEDAFLAADLTRGQSSDRSVYSGRFSVGKRGVLLAVSDGLGGAKAGEVASALVLYTLARALAEKAHFTPAKTVVDAVERAHREVRYEASRRRITMGATLTAAYILDDMAYVAEVGDSRAYLIRHGQIMRLTKDQSFVQMLIDEGGAPPEDGGLRNVILQAMGTQPNVSVALGRLELRARDCLLLCSDGLTTKLSDDDIRDTILRSPTLEKAAARLVGAANQRGGDDNTTVVLAGVGGSLLASRAGEPVEHTYRILETFDPRAMGDGAPSPRHGS